jgi:F-type H+-transporting ATPase subunit b
MTDRRLLVALVFSLLLALTAFAQHQAPPAQHAQHGSGQQELEQELTHASKEAAGEEGGGHAEFKQSPSVQFLGRITGLNVHQAYWLAIILNFLVIAGVVGYFSKAKMPGVFRGRTESIQKGIAEARKASEEANARLSDIEARLSRLDAEITDMRKSAEAEAAKEEQRIHASIEEEKNKIIQSAEQEIATAAKFARRDLKAYAAELAVSLAEKKIRIDAATDEALVSNFVEQLGKDGR